MLEEEEVQISTSGGGKIEGEVEGSDINSDEEFDDSFIEEYCETAEVADVRTVSKELFYTNKMVERRYAQLSDQDKLHFDQMKTQAEQIKREMGECDLTEEMIARVVSQRYGTMKKEDVGRVLGHEGEGAERGKVLEREAEGHLRIKQEPGIELDRVVLSAVVPTEDPAVLQYAIVKDKDRSDCFTIGSEDSDIKEINKTEVKSMFKELAELRRKEADCIDKLAQAVPEMQDHDVVIVREWTSQDVCMTCMTE